MGSRLFTRKNGKTIVYEKEDFGLADQKGRRVGAYVLIDRFDVVEVERRENERPAYYGQLNDWEGNVCFVLRVQPTRDGEGFGATQSAHYLKTLEAAKGKAKKIVDGSRKRYARRFRTVPANVEADARAAVAGVLANDAAQEAELAQAAGEAETDALAQGIAIDEAIDNLEKTARRVVLAWKFEKISGDDAVRELAGAIGELEAARAKPEPKLSVEDAIAILAGSSHGIFTVEKAREIAEALGVGGDSVAPQTFTDSRGRHKGVTLEGKAEGEKGEGVDSIDLARSICFVLGVPRDLPYYGRGSNMAELVSRISGHFAAKAGK